MRGKDLVEHAAEARLELARLGEQSRQQGVARRQRLLDSGARARDLPLAREPGQDEGADREAQQRQDVRLFFCCVFCLVLCGGMGV